MVHDGLSASRLFLLNFVLSSHFQFLNLLLGIMFHRVSVHTNPVKKNLVVKRNAFKKRKRGIVREEGHDDDLSL